MGRLRVRVLVLGAAAASVVALSGPPALAQTTTPSPAPPTTTTSIPSPSSSTTPTGTESTTPPPTSATTTPGATATPAAPRQRAQAQAAYASPCDYFPQTGYSVCGAIRDRYYALGGPGGLLGYPTSNEITTPDGAGRFNTFQSPSGHIYWSPATGAAEIGGAIFDHWGQLGYERGALGYPTSDEITNPDRIGKRNTFQNGGASIYWSPNTPASEIGGAIFAKWGEFGYETGKLGYPISDELPNLNNTGSRNIFQGLNNMIYWSGLTGAHQVGGIILLKWAGLGFETSPLGYPTSDEIVTSDGVGRFNRFALDNGSIYWTPTTDAHIITGAIAAHWADLGSERGILGYPATDSQATSQVSGQFSDFYKSVGYSSGSSTPNGSIYFSSATGAHELHGVIRNMWLSQGGPLGYHRFPVSDEIANAGGLSAAGQTRNDFEIAAIYLDNGTARNGEWMNIPADGVSASSVEFAPPADFTAQIRNSCPPGTSSYTGDAEPYNCLANLVDVNGREVGLRAGRDTDRGAFGRRHYIGKHYVDDRWVELIVQDTAAQNTGRKVTDRFTYDSTDAYGIDYRIDGRNITGIRVGVRQSASPDPSRPDDLNQGVTTAYCVDDQGLIVDTCPIGLPNPFFRSVTEFPPNPEAPYRR